MLYHPSPDPKFRKPENMPQGYRNPRENGMDYEDVYVKTKDEVRLHAWLIKAAINPSNCRTLLFFHGNAGNIGARLPNIEILVKRMNCNVLIVDLYLLPFPRSVPEYPCAKHVSASVY